MRNLRKLPTLILMVAAGCLVAAMAGGCSRKVYVPVERLSSDTLYRTRDRADTLLSRDSIYEAVRGDTVIREVYRYRLKSRLRVDTLWRTRTDTIPVVIAPVPEKSAPLPRWKTTLLTITRSLRIIFILYVFYKLLTIVLSFYKNHFRP